MIRLEETMFPPYSMVNVGVDKKYKKVEFRIYKKFLLRTFFMQLRK